MDRPPGRLGRPAAPVGLSRNSVASEGPRCGPPPPRRRAHIRMPGTIHRTVFRLTLGGRGPPRLIGTSIFIFLWPDNLALRLDCLHCGVECLDCGVECLDCGAEWGDCGVEWLECGVEWLGGQCLSAGGLLADWVGWLGS